MKEHLNDYEKRIWEGIDKDAEEIIKIAYDKGGLINADDLTEDQRKATTDNAVDYVMRFYGTFSGDGKNRYYGLNEKGFELGRRGFFSGEEKERKRQRTGVNIAIITSIASAIIAIIAIVADYLK